MTSGNAAAGSTAAFARTAPRVALVLIVFATAAIGLLPPPQAQAASCAASSAAPRCELFTTILNASDRVVTTAAVDVPVHPRVVLVGTPTPTGTIRFDWFANATCEGAPVAKSPDVSIVNGVVNATTFTQIPRKVGGYAVLARYSGDGVHGAALGDCQALTVTRFAPQLLASSLSAEVTEGDAVSVGQTASLATRLTIVSDTALSGLVVTHLYESEYLAPQSLPAGCTVVPVTPDPEHASLVCSVGRVTMGPAATTFTRVLPLEFRALKPSGPSGTSLTAHATFEFEGAGQASPRTVGPTTVDVRVLDIPRLSLPPETSATPGQRVSIPVLLDPTSLRVPADFRFIVTYDPTLLSVESVTGGTLASRGEPQWSLLSPGRLSVSVFYLGGDAAGAALESLAVVRFTVLGSAGQGVLGLVGGEAVPEQASSSRIEVAGIGGTVTVLPVQAPPLPQATPEPPAFEPPEEAALPSLWDERLWTPEHVGTSLGFATLLGVALTGLAELFNSTVEENRNHFVGWWRLRRERFRRHRPTEPEDLLPSRRAGPLAAVTFGVGVAVYLFAASVLFAFLEPERAIEAPGVAILAAGFAIVATTLASQLPRWFYVLRLHRSGALLPPPPGQRLIELHADFWTLAFALVCVLVAYETAVRPGYAYGIVGVLAINRSLRLKPDQQRGQLLPWHMDWLSMLCLFVAAVVAWLGYSIAHAEHLDVPAHLFERFWILGAETVALGLIPLSFLPGKSLWEWSRPRWACLWALALFLYIQSVTAHATGAGPLAIALTLSVYGAVTVLFWLYFKSRHDEESCVSCRAANATWKPADELSA